MKLLSLTILAVMFFSMNAEARKRSGDPKATQKSEITSEDFSQITGNKKRIIRQGRTIDTGDFSQVLERRIGGPRK